MPSTGYPSQAFYNAAQMSLVSYACLHQSSWLLNTDGSYSTIWNTMSDISRSEPNIASRVATKWDVYYTGIPKYDHYITQMDLWKLNNRSSVITPSSDWKNGVGTTAALGAVVVFGQDIGYLSPETFDPRGVMSGCNLGYWPTGPPCPGGQTGTDLNVYQRMKSFPLVPAPELSFKGTTGGGCYTGKAAIGLWVNGAEIYSWSDGYTYENENVWHRVGPKVCMCLRAVERGKGGAIVLSLSSLTPHLTLYLFPKLLYHLFFAQDEIYDMDICFGHG